MPVAVSNANAEASSSRRQIDTDPNALDERGESINVRPREEEGWTIDTFENRPIEKNNATAALLRGLIDQLKTVRLKTDEGMEKAKDAAKAIEDASPDDPLIDELEQDFKRGIEQRALIDIKIGVLEKLEMELRKNRPLYDPVSLFKEESERLEREYVAKTPRQKFKKDKDYLAFRQDIWEINHPDEGCPPMSTWLPHAEGDESDDDDEVEIGGQTQKYRCPMTLRPFVDAVTSTLCNHSYSREAIFGLIDQVAQSRRGRKETKCPLAGCQARISKDDLRPDPDLQRRTNEYEKRQKRREEEEYESDDE